MSENERDEGESEGEREGGSEDERMQGDEGEGEIEQAAKHQIKLWGCQL